MFFCFFLFFKHDFVLCSPCPPRAPLLPQTIIAVIDFLCVSAIEREPPNEWRFRLGCRSGGRRCGSHPHADTVPAPPCLWPPPARRFAPQFQPVKEHPWRPCAKCAPPGGTPSSGSKNRHPDLNRLFLIYTICENRQAFYLRRRRDCAAAPPGFSTPGSPLCKSLGPWVSRLPHPPPRFFEWFPLKNFFAIFYPRSSILAPFLGVRRDLAVMTLKPRPPGGGSSSGSLPSVPPRP